MDPDGFVYIANNYNSPGEILKINPNPASSPTLVKSLQRHVQLSI